MSFADLIQVHRSMSRKASTKELSPPTYHPARPAMVMEQRQEATEPPGSAGASAQLTVTT